VAIDVFSESVQVHRDIAFAFLIVELALVDTLAEVRVVQVQIRLDRTEYPVERGAIKG